jgi:hypothetical protein
MALMLIAAHPTAAQDSPALPSAIVDAVWSAAQAALPYPAATAEDLPEDGRPEALWVVRRRDGSDGLIAEVLANPLNPDNQRRAEKAMAAIQEAVTRAERRAQAEYERTIAAGARSAPTGELTGISLDDEGVAGERADWEARLTIEARLEHASSDRRVPGPGPLETQTIGGGVVVSAAAAEYEDETSDARVRRYRPAEARLYFGIKPSVRKLPGDTGHAIDLAGTARGVAVTLRGNSSLIKEVLTKSDWSRVVSVTPQ